MNARTSNSKARTRAGVAVSVALLLAVATPLSASAAPGRASGVGDPYFPDAGNPGYNVGHYALDIDYQPATDILTGRAVITATADTMLKSFNLDLDGLEVSAVSVNGSSAAFTRDGGELTITPTDKIKKGMPFITVVSYSGVPVSLDGAGFLHTDDGTLVIGQPRVASSWFPVNDHPSDKALYTIRITVPEGLEAISNGRLVSQHDEGGSSIWLWNTDEPMASYLATATIGQFEVDAYSADGIQYWDAIDPDLLTPAITAHTGSGVAYSGRSDNAYKRLQRTITVDPDSPELSFWVDRDIEADWDYAFLEVAPAGTDNWTTLPDADGILAQGTGNAACSELLPLHPFLDHYLSVDAEGQCHPVGTTGDWWVATGSHDGWEQWRFDLSTWVGESLDVSITLVTDYIDPRGGVAVDDVVAPGGVGSTSFEADGDALDGWTVPGAPHGSPGNMDDWRTGDAAVIGPPSTGTLVQASFARQPEIVAFLEGYFGDYPFDELGGVVDDLADVGFALEIQTRPIYSREFWSTQQNGDAVVVHEIAHQWFGDSVAVDLWADIWLNEGFATYAEWLWSEYEGTGTAQQIFDFYYGEVWPEDDPFWTVIIGDPGPDLLFDWAVYYRGAMTLHELRATIGDDAFFTLLTEWHAAHRDGNASIPEFIALAEDVSGQQLDDFFEAWLYTPDRPDVSASSLRSFGVETTPRFAHPLDLPRH